MKPWPIELELLQHLPGQKKKPGVSECRGRKSSRKKQAPLESSADEAMDTPEATPHFSRSPPKARRRIAKSPRKSRRKTSARLEAGLHTESESGESDESENENLLSSMFYRRSAAGRSALNSKRHLRTSASKHTLRESELDDDADVWKRRYMQLCKDLSGGRASQRTILQIFSCEGQGAWL
jgi:hypothetical protein